VRGRNLRLWPWHDIKPLSFLLVSFICVGMYVRVCFGVICNYDMLPLILISLIFVGIYVQYCLLQSTRGKISVAKKISAVFANLGFFMLQWTQIGISTNLSRKSHKKKQVRPALLSRAPPILQIDVWRGGRGGRSVRRANSLNSGLYPLPLTPWNIYV
jgi:predicted Kef-type K+ transport protein